MNSSKRRLRSWAGANAVKNGPTTVDDNQTSAHSNELLTQE